jgi:transposase
MKKTAIYKWVKRFSEGRESVTDKERSGRPATSRTEENIARMVKKNGKKMRQCISY